MLHATILKLCKIVLGEVPRLQKKKSKSYND